MLVAMRQALVRSLYVTSILGTAKQTFIDRSTDQLHTATASTRFNDGCRRSKWPIWCPGQGPADVYRSYDLLPILVCSSSDAHSILVVCLVTIDLLYRLYVTPIAGAYIADTYWGRYKTVCVSVAIAMLGHIIMILSAIPGVIGSDGSVGLFILSLIVTGAGGGGFKSNISPLVAEQYRRTKKFIGMTKSGERVIVDPSLTTSRIYMVSC